MKDLYKYKTVKVGDASFKLREPSGRDMAAIAAADPQDGVTALAIAVSQCLVEPELSVEELLDVPFRVLEEVGKGLESFPVLSSKDG